MPAKGKHRKPRSLSRLTRICLAAGTGAAALALPLAFTGNASAAEPAKAPAAVVKAAPAAAKAAAGTGWTKPVGNAPIGTKYHQAGAHWSSGYHTGVDFLVWTGTPVHSVAAGTVVHAGPDGAYGNDVIIKHPDGRYSLYGHLSRVEVSVGQSVTEGRQIALSGATGNVTGPHLHFEVRTTPYYGSDIDPVAYLASHGVTI
ncbi:M23 family metallopeptidase [Streptomyces sp. HPF1205]|uniref:M23 family metallopeptidase n=1 Tax=Streptomyces sp. HPF1205 TaxID=2873262 RepID=UPI001CECBB03|nr:M23 family metallopeptidase [Streptomyces sp. HPF1205]